jgi:hypothetical protein
VDAVGSARESVDKYRRLSSDHPAFLPDLAAALKNLAIDSRELGQLSEALSAAEEAVGLYRAAAAKDPGLLPDLAGSLTNLASTMATWAATPTRRPPPRRPPTSFARPPRGTPFCCPTSPAP